MAAAATKAPLKSSSSHNAAAGGGGEKTIEETYQKLTQLEHILVRPDTYIGSIEKQTQKLWVYEDGAMAHRDIDFVPGLYKIFDEILVNAADNKQRDPSMDSLRVDIDVAGCCISVYNNGDGVPVEIHQEERIYVPELIFGHLLTSSNYNDNEQKTTGGRNGYGAKLTNIFSTEFVIETADGRRQKKYKQVSPFYA
jgi:DNA topoisomerase-2